MVLMVLFMGSVVFSSCGGDDDDDNSQSSQTIQSMWKCVSTTHTEIDNPENHGLGFDVGARIKLIEDGICFIDYNGKGFELPGGGHKENPTKQDWNLEDGDKWFLKGNILSIMESDLDRWVGTVSINGNEMTSFINISTVALTRTSTRCSLFASAWTTMLTSTGLCAVSLVPTA